MEEDNTIRSIDFKQAISERYLSYALSTIMSRSLPDVRDGLKPVHRRLIYAMHALSLNPNTAHKKCARVVGDVMGKFHPHGEQAIYGALVRLAQNFSLRYPLIDGQGNFGNIDGDSAAAMRYTEARLTPIALCMLEGLETNAVDVKDTYDGEEFEPTVLPAAFPNLLANGSSGIAVGMATSIPPHNLDELCEALIHLIEHPSASVTELLKFIPGPDFPTGGIICENEDHIKTIYETGKGSIRLRAQWSTENRKGGSYAIIITQIPYMVEKSRLIEKIADLITQKKLSLLDDVIDESTEDIRIVLIPKLRTIDAQLLMESLFKQTDLETRIPVNLNTLDKNLVPRIMNLKEILAAFLEHRQQVTTRCTQHRLDRIQERLEILAGYLIAYLNLDEVIRIIRDEDDPKAVMIETFNLNDVQVDAILNMRLRALRKLQEIEIKKEFDQLKDEQEELKILLDQPKKLWAKIKKDLKEIQKRFGKITQLGERRTIIAPTPTAVIIPFEDPITPEDVTIICSAKNWIRVIKGHEVSNIKYKEGDEERFILQANTTDKLILAAKKGRTFTLNVDKLPRSRHHGEALRLMIDLEADDDIVDLILVKQASPQEYLVVSSDARGFIISNQELISQTRLGKVLMNLAPNASLIKLIPCVHNHVAIIGQNRKLLIFSKDEIPVMNRGRGVTLQKYKDGQLSDVILFNLEEGLKFNNKKKEYVVKDLRLWLGKRGGLGRLAPMGFSLTNKF